MIIKDFKAFEGQHCETTATGSLLNQIGIELSEPMLFGLGEGLGFIYWNMKSMGFPFIGGRVKTDLLTENICNNLNLKLVVSETSSVKKAWKNASEHIKEGKAVGIKFDCYHLEYFSSKFHFAGHYAALYGFDNESVYLVDTKQQGGKVKTSLKSFELARNERGPMASKNLSYVISKNNSDYKLAQACKQAIYKNAFAYLNPPIKNIAYKGILKASTEIKKWFKNSADVKRDFQTTAMLMEKAGTGGSLFRNLYRDFLKESSELLNSEVIDACYRDFILIAEKWKKVAGLFYQAGETEDVAYINEASDLLIDLSNSERLVMQKLEKACA